MSASVSGDASGEKGGRSWDADHDNSACGAAAAALLLAGRLSASQREHCILDAIDCHLLAGDRAAASALAGDLSTFLPGARRDHALARGGFPRRLWLVRYARRRARRRRRLALHSRA